MFKLFKGLSRKSGSLKFKMFKGFKMFKALCASPLELLNH